MLLRFINRKVTLLPIYKSQVHAKVVELVIYKLPSDFICNMLNNTKYNKILSK